MSQFDVPTTTMPTTTVAATSALAHKFNLSSSTFSLSSSTTTTTTTSLPTASNSNLAWEPIIYAATNQLHETASVYLFCCALSLAAISAFLRAGFVLKFFVMLACIGAQGCVLHLSRLYQRYDAIANEK